MVLLALDDDESDDDDEFCENGDEADYDDEIDSSAPPNPVHYSPPALPSEPFVVESIPGNMFRILRQHLEITNARLVRLSGLKLPDIEHAEIGTMLVPPTLFEALLAATELPTLSEPDTLIAYLAEALHKRTPEHEIPAPAPPPMPAFSGGNGKDAAAIEAVHYRWAYDRVTAELNELKAEHRDLSRTAAERLARLHELERELDRLHVQQTLSDELGTEYAEEMSYHKERINAEVSSQQDRFLAAKTTALELLPAVMPMLTAFAQNLRKPDISAPEYQPPHCTTPPAPQRPIAQTNSTPQNSYSSHQFYQHHEPHQTTNETSEYAQTIS